MIWALSQAKKTNMIKVLNIMWCIRYGTRGNTELRGANPLSCYTCSLRSSCPNYEIVKSKKVYFIEEKDELLKEVKTTEKSKPKRILEDKEIGNYAETAKCTFICLTKNGVPKKILEKRESRKKRWLLIDEFSGYPLSDEYSISCKKNTVSGESTAISEFIELLPEYHGRREKNYNSAISDEWE